MQASLEKQHLSVAICGHADSGKSTMASHLLLELGCHSERELRSMIAAAEGLGRDRSAGYAFLMNRSEEERRRGVTIACNIRDFCTSKWHCTLIDAPGHRDFIKNMITGTSQADTAVIVVPADGDFTAAIAKGIHKNGQIQGQTRQHSRLLCLLGIKQICIAVNKMDCQAAAYKQDRYNEIATEMKSMLLKVGWRKDVVEKQMPVLPISGLVGDNLTKKSENMLWWHGSDIEVDGGMARIETLYDFLNELCRPPSRNVDAPMRMPVSGVYRIPGIGHVVTGRIEQGVVRPGEEVMFLPAHSSSVLCSGKVRTLEMHHKLIPQASAGDIVGLAVEGLHSGNQPRSGDIMVFKEDTTLAEVRSFEAQVQVIDIPGEIIAGYTPVGFVRSGRAACRLVELKWKMGRETGGRKIECPGSLKPNEMAACTFQVLQPFVCDSFRNCQGLARIAFMDGNSCVMLGKIVDCERREDLHRQVFASVGGKKK